MRPPSRIVIWGAPHARGASEAIAADTEKRQAAKRREPVSLRIIVAPCRSLGARCPHPGEPITSIRRLRTNRKVLQSVTVTVSDAHRAISAIYRIESPRLIAGL